MGSCWRGLFFEGRAELEAELFADLHEVAKEGGELVTQDGVLGGELEACDDLLFACGVGERGRIGQLLFATGDLLGELEALFDEAEDGEIDVIDLLAKVWKGWGLVCHLFVAGVLFYLIRLCRACAQGESLCRLFFGRQPKRKRAW